jgi:hypothetical protein
LVEREFIQVLVCGIEVRDVFRPDGIAPGQQGFVIPDALPGGQRMQTERPDCGRER